MVHELKIISTAALVAMATMMPQGIVAFAPSSHIAKTHKAAFTTSRVAPKTPLFMSDEDQEVSGLHENINARMVFISSLHLLQVGKHSHI